MEIHCRNLSYTYPGGTDPVFHGLTWSLTGPGFFSFFGFSGVGKSTLARLICKDIKPESGQLTMKGVSRVLYAHNAERLPGWGSVGDHLRGVTDRGREPLLKDLIETCRIGSCMEKGFNGLSMGQKNRVNITRYLVQDFDLLILDEVLANVDEPARNRILLSLKSWFPDKTFVYISHNALEVARFSRSVFVLPQGTDQGVDFVREISGLDQTRQRGAPPELLQQKVYSILKAAGSVLPES